MVINRRDLLAIGAGAVAAPALTAVDKQSRLSKPHSAVPSGATDCHTHTYLDPAEFAMLADRHYTPALATTEDLRAFHMAIGIERSVLVTPSVYGTDNSAMQHSIDLLGAQSARGVAVIGADTSQETIAALHRGGFRGVRMNAGFDPDADIAPIRAEFERTVQQIAPHGWHLQIYAELNLLMQLSDLIQRSPIPVVLDHFAGLNTRSNGNSAKFGHVLDWIRWGHVWVKLSGAYLVADFDDNYAAATPFARELVEANPDRLVWGSDWPHPGFMYATTIGRKLAGIDPASAPTPVVDAGALIDLLVDWVPGARVRHKILVDNPARLYDFPR